MGLPDISEPSAIDFQHLGLYTGGDVALNREVLKLFRGQCAQLLEQLQSEPDDEGYRYAAHSLKGAARAVGAWTVAEAAQHVEQVREAPAATRRAAIAVLADAFAQASAVALSYESGD